MKQIQFKSMVSSVEEVCAPSEAIRACYTELYVLCRSGSGSGSGANSRSQHKSGSCKVISFLILAPCLQNENGNGSLRQFPQRCFECSEYPFTYNSQNGWLVSQIQDFGLGIQQGARRKCYLYLHFILCFFRGRMLCLWLLVLETCVKLDVSCTICFLEEKFIPEYYMVGLLGNSTRR